MDSLPLYYIAARKCMQKENNMSNKEISQRLAEARAIIDECIAVLSNGKISKKGKSSAKSVDTKSTRPTKLNFELNEKNFIKTYAKGLSGPKKFTLLIAHITKGKTGVDVEIGTISSKWNKMKAKNLLGYAFNSKYPTEAVTQGWVDSKKYGSYHLRQEWMSVFD